MTSWKIFAVDTQFKQLRKRSLKKKFRLQRDSNPWPLRYRCSALPTELWSHNCWEQVNFSGSIMPLRVIQHHSDWVCTAVISKWRHERSSRLIRNLSNCEREAWKKFRLQRDSNPWPLRYRCSALPTELWSHNCWEQVNFSGSIMPLRVIQHYSDWVCTAVISKWRHERSSRLIRNLSNCEREAWKKFRLQRDSNPWPLRYRCSALPTELWSHNCWEQVNFSGSIMPLRVIQHYSDWVCTAVISKWRHDVIYIRNCTPNIVELTMLWLFAPVFFYFSDGRSLEGGRLSNFIIFSHIFLWS